MASGGFLKQVNKLKGAMPDYMDLLDRMSVTGETAYVPGHRNAPYHVTSDDDEDVRTPQSTGGSTRSTGRSHNKTSRSAAVRMNENMRNLIVSLDNRNKLMKEIWDKRQQAVQDRKNAKLDTVDLVMKLAREAGATEEDEKLWVGVAVLSSNLDEAATRMFLKSDPKGRMAIIKHYAELAGQPTAQVTVATDDDDEQWEEDFFSMFFEDTDEQAAIRYGIWCLDVLLGGRRLRNPSGVPCSLQGNEVPHSRLSKRRRSSR